MRLVEQTVPRDDPEPKALAWYGLLVRHGATPEALWLRFVEGRPLSAITTAFLTWCGERLAAPGVTTLVLVWDNAAWHISTAVRTWPRTHNQRVHRDGGVRIIPCRLPAAGCRPRAPGSTRSSRRGSTASDASSNPPGC